MFENFKIEGIGTVLIYGPRYIFLSDPNPPTLAHSAYSYGPEGFGGGSGQWIIANDTAKVLPEENINGELFLFRLQGPLEYSRAPTYWDFFQTNE